MENINKLVEDNIKLVNWVIETKIKYIPNRMKADKRDIYQEGCVLLVQAAKNFDESKGYKFSTYATNTVYLGLKNFIDRYGEKRYGLEGFSLENEVYKDDDGITWKELLETEEEGFEIILFKNAIKASKVKDIDKIIKMKLRGCGNKEVQKELEICYGTLKARIDNFKSEIKGA